MTVRDDRPGLKGTVLDGSRSVPRTTPQARPGGTVREPKTPGGTAIQTDGAKGTMGGAWLPSELAKRFKVTKPFAARGGEADIYLVSDDYGKQWVAKIYREGIAPKKAVLEKIRTADRRYVVRLEEFGCSDGRWWELLEYAPLGTLREVLAERGRKPDPALARDVLKELAAALAHLHARDIAHRDLKPDNVLVRKREPLELVLNDFGTASIVAGLAIRFSVTARTLAYAPPEAAGTLTMDEKGRTVNKSSVEHSGDYWSLGMILVEIVTGSHPFCHVDEAAIGRRLATMDTDDLSEAVVDPAWRKLCRGLLRRDPKHRWGAGQVDQWLRDPNDPSLKVAAEERPLGTPAPGFRFQGREYATPQQLAAAMSQHWEGAESLWKERNNELRAWLEHDLGHVALAAALKAIDLKKALNLDAQLFLALSALDPKQLPRFRGRELSSNVLATAVEQALGGDPAARDWLDRLHTAAVLRSIVPETAEAKRLRQIGNEWFTNVSEYQGLESDLRHRGASVQQLDTAALTTLLACSIPVPSVVKELRKRAEQAITADALKQEWFKRMGSGRKATAAALLVIPQVAGFAALDARERRYERNLSIYGRIAKSLIGLNFGVVFGVITAYIPGFIAYWLIRWIWDPEVAFTAMLGWVGVAGLLGASASWPGVKTLVGGRSRKPSVPVIRGLMLSGVGLAGLAFLWSWGSAYFLDRPSESVGVRPQVTISPTWQPPPLEKIEDVEAPKLPRREVLHGEMQQFSPENAPPTSVETQSRTVPDGCLVVPGGKVECF